MNAQEILRQYSYVASQSTIHDIEQLLLADIVPTEVSTLPSLLLLKGLGKEIWKAVDAQKYIEKLRNEWED